MATIAVPAPAVRPRALASPKPLLALWVATMLFFRPSAPGEFYNPLVFAIFVALTFVMVIIRPGSILTFKTSAGKLLTFSVILLTALYFLLQGLLLSTAQQTVINSSTVILGTACCITLIANRKNTRFILQTFVVVHFILACSALISTLLLILNHFDRTPLVIARYSIYLTDYHFLMIPFSLYWSEIGLFGLRLYRFLGIYREPGVAQIYFMTAFFLTYFIPVPRQRLIRWTIFSASVLIFSTAGLLSLIAGIICLYALNDEKRRLNPRILLTGIVLTIFILYALFVPDFGLLTKVGTESGQSRFDSFQYGLSQLLERPLFGFGYYYGFGYDSNRNLVGNFFMGMVGVSYQIGLVGLLLYFACWYSGLFFLGNWRTLCIYIPCLITLLVSQPTYNDVFVWFLLLVDTRPYHLLAPLRKRANETINRHPVLQ